MKKSLLILGSFLFASVYAYGDFGGYDSSYNSFGYRGNENYAQQQRIYEQQREQQRQLEEMQSRQADMEYRYRQELQRQREQEFARKFRINQ